MLRSSLRLRRNAVALLGCAVVAAGLPTLLGVAANAVGPVITLTGPASASAGTCAVFTATVTNEVGEVITTLPATSTVKLELRENPSTDAQDLDFCVVSSETTTGATQAEYTNGPVLGPPPANASAQKYTPGTSITPAPGQTASASDNPDLASMGTSPPGPGTGNANANPTGVDTLTLTAPTNPVRFGVVGLSPSTTPTVSATYDPDGGGSAAAAPTSTKTLRITAGGVPGSTAARDAVSSLSVDPTETFSNLGSGTTAAKPAQFTVTARNSDGDTVSGVPLNFQLEAGSANSPTTSGGAPTATFTCTPAQTSNAGTSACSYQGQKEGVDQVRIFVNQTKGTPTGNWDTGEPFVIETVTTFAAPTDRSQARYIDVRPDTATVTAGASRTFTAVVTSLDGRPVEGAVLTFTETGPGQLRGGTVTSAGTSILQGTTDSTGSARVILDTATSDNGDGTLSASINDPSTTQCQSTTPTTSRAGNCVDTSTFRVAGKASGSPSPTTSATPTATMTATATATATSTQTATTTATATQTTSSPPTCSTAQQNLPIRYLAPQAKVSRTGATGPVVNATALVTVSVTGATPNRVVELEAYQQNHFGTANFANAGNIRTATADNNGVASFQVRFSSNARARAKMQSCPAFGTNAGFNQGSNGAASNVLYVRTVLTFTVTRVGTRTITIVGDSIPARPGGLIVNIHCTDARCKSPSNPNGILFQPRANQVNGEFGPVRYTFAPSFQNNRVTLYAATGVQQTGEGDAQNVAGRSNNRSVLVF